MGPDFAEQARHAFEADEAFEPSSCNTAAPDFAEAVRKHAALDPETMRPWRHVIDCDRCPMQMTGPDATCCGGQVYPVCLSPDCACDFQPGSCRASRGGDWSDSAAEVSRRLKAQERGARISFALGAFGVGLATAAAIITLAWWWLR